MATFPGARPAIRARLLARYPARYIGDGGISATVNDGIVTIAPDYDSLVPDPSPGAGDYEIMARNVHTGETRLIDLQTLDLGPIEIADVTDATTVGQDLVKASDEAAARATIDAASTALATDVVPGLMAAADKTKLDDLPVAAEIESDFDDRVSRSATPATIGDLPRPNDIVMTGGALNAADGGGAAWIYSGSDLSVEVANDPAGVMYRGWPNTNGSEGAYVRQYGNQIDVGAFRTAPGEVTADAITAAAAFEAAQKADSKSVIQSPIIVDLSSNRIDITCPANTTLGQARFVEACKYAAAQGKYVRAGSGTWIATDTILETTYSNGNTVTVEGVGGGRTIILHRALAKTLFRRVGSMTTATLSSTKFASAETRGSVVMTADGGNTYDLAAGDYVMVIDRNVIVSDYGSDGNRAIPYCYQGQWNRIKSISGSTITFYGAHEWDYSTSTRVRKASHGGGLIARDLVIDMHDDDMARFLLDPSDPNYLNPATAAFNGFQSAITKGSVFEGITMRRFFRTGISISAAIDVKISDINGIDMGAHNSTGSYVIAMGGACWDVRADNVRSENCRHLVTSVVSPDYDSGTDTYTPADTIESAHVSFSNCHGMNHRFTPFDLHPGARHVVFNHCHAWSSAKTTGGTDGQGFQPRGRYITMNSCTAVGTYRGLYTAFGDHIIINDFVADNCTIGMDIFRSPYTQVNGAVIRDPVDRGVWAHSDGAGTSSFDVMTRISLKNIVVNGNPSIAAFGFDGYDDTWDIDYGKSLKAPDATTKFTGLPIKFFRPPNEWDILYSASPGTVHTGTTSETTILTVVLPGGSMGPNGILRIRSAFTKNNNVNVKTMKVQLDGTSFLNATQTNGVQPLETELEIRNTNTESEQEGQVRSSTNGATLTWLTLSGVSGKNTASNLNIQVKVTLADVADTITLEYFRVEVLYRA